MVEFEDNHLQIGDSEAKFESNIDSVVSVDDVVAVLLEPQGSDPERDNIIAFDQNGTKLWQAEPVRPFASGADCYMRIWEREGELWAGSWGGYEYQIDLETGEHIDSEFVK